MLVEEVKTILSTEVGQVIASPLSLNLIKCYSKLYAHGAQVGFCAASQRKYYSQLLINGIDMATIYDEAQQRTCVPNWKGLKYISATAKHWSGSLLTDKDAMYLLTNGFLKEDSFIKLPNEYLLTVCKQEIKEVKENVSISQKKRKK